MLLHLSLSLFASLPIALLCIIFTCSCLRQSIRTWAYRLPPGPRPLPIIGNFLSLGPLPHRDVAKLSKIYGPILSLRLGSVHNIFISSPPLAEQVLKTHDVVFANRSQSEAAELLSYGYKGFSSASGPYLRIVRKLCVNQLFTPGKLDLYGFIRKEEVAYFVESLKEAAQARVAIDLTTMVRSLASDMVCRMVVGRKSTDGGKLREHIEEVMRILGSFNVNDHVPVLGWLDLQGIRRRARAARGPIDRFLEEIIAEHEKLRAGGKKHNDFLDVLLDCMNHRDAEVELDRTTIKAIILDIFEGAMDSIPTAIEWTLVELLRCPEVMKKTREELERVVGLHRAVEESDLPNLTYLGMVVKESLRLHTPGPFIYHCTKQNFKLDGYDIPKGSNVMVCHWALARDPSLWPDPEEFIPERFEKCAVDVKGHDFHLLPFGSGRRQCPGMSYALLVMTLVVARLAHCFDWELPNGMSPSELDMTEKLGFSMPRTVHLRVTPVYRLSDA